MSVAAEPDIRNAFGYPRIETHAPNNRAPFHQAIDASSNKALPWVAFSWFLSGGAIIGLILMALLVPKLIDYRVDNVKVELGKQVVEQVAEVKIQIAQQVSDAKATSTVGAQHARIALSEVERANAELAAKGLIKLASH